MNFGWCQLNWKTKIQYSKRVCVAWSGIKSGSHMFRYSSLHVQKTGFMRSFSPSIHNPRAPHWVLMASGVPRIKFSQTTWRMDIPRARSSMCRPPGHSRTSSTCSRQRVYLHQCTLQSSKWSSQHSMCPSCGILSRPLQMMELGSVDCSEGRHYGRLTKDSASGAGAARANVAPRRRKTALKLSFILEVELYSERWSCGDFGCCSTVLRPGRSLYPSTEDFDTDSSSPAPGAGTSGNLADRLSNQSMYMSRLLKGAIGNRASHSAATCQRIVALVDPNSRPCRISPRRTWRLLGWECGGR